MWKAIGMELGVDGDTLSDIEKNHTDDSDRLHAVIDSANPAPTREAMTKILDSANISNAIAGMHDNVRGSDISFSPSLHHTHTIKA